jgi:Cu+-exporting ATPase
MFSIAGGNPALGTKARFARTISTDLGKGPVTGWFVPAVILISILTFAIWAFFGPDPKLAHALVNAVAVLIIAWPCALGLATPMSIMVGTGRGAQAGVLIRNAEALETLEKVDTVVLIRLGH